jgi:hypothetical protein
LAIALWHLLGFPSWRRRRRREFALVVRGRPAENTPAPLVAMLRENSLGEMRMTATNRTGRPRRRLLLLAVALGLIGAATAGWFPTDRVLVWHWRARLVTADDQQAAHYVEQIAARGECGLEALTALLGSARTSVAEAARQAIHREISTWSGLESAQRRQRAVRLAEALAAHMEQYPPTARRVASGFAVQFMHEPCCGRGEPCPELVAACEKILRASIVERHQAMLARRAGGDKAESRERDRLGADNDLALPLRIKAAPGGGLPLGAVPGHSTTDRSNDHAPGDVVPGPESGAQAASDEPARLSPEAAANSAAQALPPAEERMPLRQPEQAHSSREPPPGADPTDTLRWMHALHSDDLALRIRAEEELGRQGFEALQIELARQLTDPDPRVRRELAESLPAMPGIDAHVWLVWLSRDEHPDVRLAAMTVMATTADPNVLRRLEQMARTDPDPRVQRQGEKLLGLREAERQPNGGRRRSR